MSVGQCRDVNPKKCLELLLHISTYDHPVSFAKRIEESGALNAVRGCFAMVGLMPCTGLLIGSWPVLQAFEMCFRAVEAHPTFDEEDHEHIAVVALRTLSGMASICPRCNIGMVCGISAEIVRVLTCCEAGIGCAAHRATMAFLLPLVVRNSADAAAPEKQATSMVCLSAVIEGARSVLSSATHEWTGMLDRLSQVCAWLKTLLSADLTFRF